MKICVIGTGYVGLVTGVGLAELGNKVVCVDVDKEKIRELKKGRVPFYEEGLEDYIRKNQEEGKISFTSDLSEGVSSSSIIFIAVGTPAKENGEADLSFVIKVAEDLVYLINEYKIIAVKSTVPVGTLELIKEILKREGKRKGIDFDVASTPEFLREGKAVYDFFHPTRIVIGAENPKVGEKLSKLFSPLGAPVVRTTFVAAQMIKYAANAFLASRISFVNEIANICEKVGADVREVTRGLSYDKRLGEGYLNPGIGFGGPCLIKDLKALIKIAETNAYQANYLKSILEKNEHQIKTILYKVRKGMGGSLYSKEVGILGLSFKAGTSDVRTSLTLRIIKLLQKEGAKIKAYDPKGMEEAKRIIPDVIFTESPYQAANSDVLLVLTDWDEFKELDLERIKKNLKTPFVIDGVNIFDPEKMREMGFTYQGVGR